MKRDMRDSNYYKQAEELYYQLQPPGEIQPCYASEMQVVPDGKSAVFSGSFIKREENAPYTRICQIDFSSGEIRTLTSGPNSDRLPKYAPNGKVVAFLSDRGRAGDYQLYLFDLSSGAVTSAPRPAGWIEYLHWSPDGRQILLGVAGYSSDIAGIQGAVTHAYHIAENIPSWVPSMETGDYAEQWRQLWVYEPGSGKISRLSKADCNIWEAAWCGNDAAVAVVSAKPIEADWYTAGLYILNKDGHRRRIYTSTSQLGLPVASPSGRWLAFVEGISSHRCIIAGDLMLVAADSGKAIRIDTQNVDITYIEWRTEHRLLLAGQRKFETVVALYDLSAETFTELWSSCRPTIAGHSATVSGFNDDGDCAFIAEDFLEFPEIATLRRGIYQTIKSLAQDETLAKEIKSLARPEMLHWPTIDDQTIYGWLLRPEKTAPFATVVYLHDGPVNHWRPQWLARDSRFSILMLIKHGYAVFLPNPRGSSGRGQAFRRGIVGDIGGNDALDCLSGIDYLVKEKLADPQRLGVAGHSYGGYMASFLIAQDRPFAAAVASAPITNYVSQHLLSNISSFVKIFLDDDYNNPEGRYYDRSPVMYAKGITTPTLNIGGALDRFTPAAEARQFHNALLESGCESALVIYPEEGHQIKNTAAIIDYAARILSWFNKYMPAAENRQNITFARTLR